MTSPEISVIVPTRNRAALVGRLLMQLTRPHTPRPTQEIVVVDEASTDATPELLDGFSSRHGVRVVRHDSPLGLSAARNAGVKAATGDYLAWIDDDDLTAPDRLQRQLDALRHGPFRWSCAARVDIDDDLRVIGHRRCPGSEGLLTALLRSNCLPTAGQGLVVERSLAEEVGPYDERLSSAEDWDYCIRLMQRATPHLLDEPLVGYRIGPTSMSTNTGRMIEAIEAVIAKHAALYEEHGVTPDWAAIHQSLLTADLRHSRWRAGARAVRLARAEPSSLALLRVGLVLAVPRWFERRSAERRRLQVPAWWEAQARRWLDDVGTSSS